MEKAGAGHTVPGLSNYEFGLPPADSREALKHFDLARAAVRLPFQRDYSGCLKTFGCAKADEEMIASDHGERVR